MVSRFEVETEKLTEDMRIDAPIYTRNAAGQDVLLVHGGVQVDQRVMGILARNNVRRVKVLSRYYRPGPEAEAAVEEDTPNEAPRGPSFSIRFEVPPVKTIIDEGLRKEATDSIDQLFTDISHFAESDNLTTAYQSLNNFEKVLNQVVATMTQDESGFIHIHDLKSYDRYTYHHSLSVALLAAAIGQALGFDFRRIHKLTKCAMLHDIGKQVVPLSIINKPGKLTEAEFAQIKEQPAAGANILKAKGVGDQELWNGVMFHHEKLNGKGYPKGLENKEVPMFSRIISVADVYDALTSYRPYRTPDVPPKACDIIIAERDTTFDYDVIQAFIDRLILYPVNTILELSDKRIAIVMNNDNATRPIIKIGETREMIDLSSAKYQDLIITKVVDPNAALG